MNQTQKDKTSTDVAAAIAALDGLKAMLCEYGETADRVCAELQQTWPLLGVMRDVVRTTRDQRALLGIPETAEVILSGPLATRVLKVWNEYMSAVAEGEIARPLPFVS